VHELSLSVPAQGRGDSAPSSDARPCWRTVGVFRAYHRVEFLDIVGLVGPAPKKLSRVAPKTQESTAMDTNTLLINVVVIFLFGGFGFYGRGRWF
jgi:hypothetical protein